MIARALMAVFLAATLAAAASAQDFSAVLDGLQETVPVVTPGTGTGTADFDPATNILSVSLSFSGLIGTTTDSHIHCCVDAPASVGVALGFTATFPLGVTAGNFVGNYNLLDPNVYTSGFRTNFGGGTAAGSRDALLAGMRSGRAYFNIHTSHRGGGEIRGNITPEPSSLLLALGGLGAVGLMCRRRMN